VPIRRTRRSLARDHAAPARTLVLVEAPGLLANPLPPPNENAVADVAHEPRRAVADDSANRCSACRGTVRASASSRSFWTAV
jgi:hypothetical protein